MKFAKLFTTLAAIAAITFLDYCALNRGIDGIALAGAVAIIAGLGGYETKQLVQLLKTAARTKK